MAARPKTAFNKNSNAITVWTDFYQQNQILASYFNRSSRSWSDPVPVSERGYSDHAQLAINRHGNAITVWKEREQLWANHFNGSNWGTPAPIGTIGSSDSFQNYGEQGTNNNIAFDDNNHAHVVWVQTVDGNSNVWANSFDGNRWGTATPIENTNKEINETVRVGTSRKKNRELGPMYVTISIDINGNAHAIWERGTLTGGRESNFTPWKSTITKTIWTSQLKTIRPIIIDEAIVYTDYHAVILSGSGFTNVIDERTYKQVKLVDQNGNSPSRVYRWGDNLIIAVFRELPKSVTIIIPNQTKIIPFLVEYPR